MAEISLTTDWFQINDQFTQNGGLFVKTGTIELITSNTLPLSTDKGLKLGIKTFFNIFPSIKTYVRSTSFAVSLMAINNV